MDDITLTRELRRQGYGAGEIRTLLGSGDLTRIRHGAYRVGGPDDSDGRQAHRRLVEATVGQCGSDVVVSHSSAAVLHGLPTWRSELARVQLSRNRPGGGVTRRWVRIRGLPMEADEIRTIDRIAVTSLARTVLDLACLYPMDRAVAVGDAALRIGVREGDLADLVQRAGPRRGIGAARRAISLMDHRSESVGESRSRVVLHRAGIPWPELQFQICDAQGRFVARTDFGWPEFRTVGEFDGRVKYQRALRPGHDPERELFLEKRREDAIRDQRFEVVRWINTDLDQPSELIARLQRAFERGRRSR